MSISLTIGTNAPLNFSDVNLADLKNAASTADLHLGKEFVQYLDGPISAVPDNLGSALLNESVGNQTWKPGSGPLTFTLSGSVSGGITIVQCGTLLSYTDSFPTMGSGLGATQNSCNTQTINAAPNTSYVCLQLQCCLNVAAAATYTTGPYGVCANGSVASTITIAFYKAVAPDTPLHQAIEQAFRDFVFPLHPQTLKNLKVGDYLHYTFNAKLQLSIGASVNVPAFNYAGQGAHDILGGAVTGQAGINLGIQAGVKATFCCDYGGTFETLLWLSDSTHAQFHLYRSKTQTVGLDVNATLCISANTTQTATVSAQVAVDAITKSLSPSIQGGMNTMLQKCQPQVNNWTTEVNNKVACWLKPFESTNSSLDAAITRTSDTFILCDYTIDLTQNYASAWTAMTQGRFYDALATPNSGLSLSTGSGLEAIYKKTASLTINLFGKLNEQWTDNLISNAEFIYAGNNIFHLNVDTGRQLLANINGHRSEIDLYFAACADLTQQTQPITDVNLHITLQSNNDGKFGNFLSVIMSHLATDATSVALAAAIEASSKQPNTTQSLHFIFAPGAYANIQASNLAARPFNDAIDQGNYQAFTSACGALSAFSPYNSPPAGFTFDNQPLSYNIWAACNIAYNDQPGGTSNPNRRSPGGVGGTNVATELNNFFSSLDNGTVSLISYAFASAAEFMNLCDDLHQLATQPLEANASTWDSAIKTLQKIIKNDVSTDYIPPTGLALAHLCGVAPSTISGPATNLGAAPCIGVTLTFGQTS